MEYQNFRCHQVFKIIRFFTNYFRSKMYSTKMLGEIKLIFWSTGPTDPILGKNKKNDITKFWPTGFFI